MLEMMEAAAVGAIVGLSLLSVFLIGFAVAYTVVGFVVRRDQR